MCNMRLVEGRHQSTIIIINIIIIKLHVDCATCKDENVPGREGFGFPVTVEPGNTSDDEHDHREDSDHCDRFNIHDDDDKSITHNMTLAEISFGSSVNHRDHCDHRDNSDNRFDIHDSH